MTFGCFKSCATIQKQTKNKNNKVSNKRKTNQNVMSIDLKDEQNRIKRKENIQQTKKMEAQQNKIQMKKFSQQQAIKNNNDNETIQLYVEEQLSIYKPKPIYDQSKVVMNVQISGDSSKVQNNSSPLTTEQLIKQLNSSFGQLVDQIDKKQIPYFDYNKIKDYEHYVILRTKNQDQNMKNLDNIKQRSKSYLKIKNNQNQRQGLNTNITTKSQIKTYRMNEDYEVDKRLTIDTRKAMIKSKELTKDLMIRSSIK